MVIAPHVWGLLHWAQLLLGKGDGRSRRMQAVIDRGLFIDSGFFSGLEAMSEMRDLLDDLYGSLD